MPPKAFLVTQPGLPKSSSSEHIKAVLVFQWLPPMFILGNG